MKLLFIIPARKGSKGLPGKNIKKFLGKPLISHTIDFAIKNSTIKDKIVINSNDNEVIKIAKNKGIFQSLDLKNYPK